MNKHEDLWTSERIASLSTADIQNLRHNALHRGSPTIVERCDAELAKRASAVKRVPAPTNRKAMLPITEATVEKVAALIKALPPAEAVPFAQKRLRLLTEPVTTFSALWRQFIVCGFSSQEKSDPETPLGAFSRGDSPILDLPSVLAHGKALTWITEQLARAGLNRMTTKKAHLVSSAREAFLCAEGRDDALANGQVAGSALEIFVDLASGRVNDRNLAASAAFSASLDPSPFKGIGHKQIRNILVNSGLAHNVVPIDSRWRSFFGDALEFSTADLGQLSKYLAIEDVLRNALLSVQADRPDIPNLAVLDSMAFASQSSKGYGVDGWAGS